MSVDIRGTTGITAPGFSGDGAGLSGVVTPDSNQICKAWVNFNGTGTVAIRDSFNVSSIIDIGTATYLCSFVTPMPSINYSVSGSCVGSQVNYFHSIIASDTPGNGGAPTTIYSVRIRTVHVDAGHTYDMDVVNLQIFGN